MVGPTPEADERVAAEGRLPDMVVFVTNVSRGIIGGVIQYMEPLERLLPKRGIGVISLQFPKFLNLMESRGLPKIFRAPLHVGFVVFCIVRILRLRRHRSTVLVHSHGASYALLTSFLAHMMGYPTVHTFHSPVARKSLTLRLFAPKLDTLVFVSQNLHNLIRNVSDVQNRSIDYIPGSVDIDAFSPAPPAEKASLRRNFLYTFGLPDRGLLSLFVGRITPEKGVLEVVEAAGHLKALDTPTCILIVGPVLATRTAESYQAEIQSRIRKLGVEEWVALTGPVTHPVKERLMAASDIFVCSSLWEASGLSVVEALASGVPVVASRAGGLRERVRHGENGLLVEPGNPSELAMAIDQLARSPSLRLKMGQNAREDAVVHYGIESFIEAHLQLYSRVLTSRPS